MSDASVLATIKSQILARLQEITASPKANYDVDGQRFDWGDYQKMLFEQLDRVNAQIDRESGPIEESTFVCL